MISSILSLISCLQAKRLLMTCDHAQYDAISADYELIMSLFTQLVNNGQAGITSGQEDILKELLKLLKKWGCQNDSILDEPISTVNWCLCGSGASGGKFTYGAGNGAMVSSTVNAAASFSKSNGIGTFAVTSGFLLGGTVTGTAADATYDSNGATNSFKLVIPVKDASVSYATLLASLVQVWDTTNSSNITDAFPLVMDMGAIQKRIVDVSSNTVSIVFTGLGSVYQGGWMITFVNP
jgi:hypothetical protein